MDAMNQIALSIWNHWYEALPAAMLLGYFTYKFSTQAIEEGAFTDYDFNIVDFIVGIILLVMAIWTFVLTARVCWLGYWAILG